MGTTCNPNNLQFYELYLLIKGYLLLNGSLLEPQEGAETSCSGQFHGSSARTSVTQVDTANLHDPKRLKPWDV